MVKMTWDDFCEVMSKRATAIHNGENLKHLTGVIVFDQSSWDEEYSEESRSYAVCSNDKKFGNWYIGSSLHGDSLDGSDRGVRLDWYMSKVDNKRPWKVEYCYIMEGQE